MKNISMSRELLNLIAEEEIYKKHEKKCKREVLKRRTNELVAEGIDKQLAKVMAQSEYDCGLIVAV